MSLTYSIPNVINQDQEKQLLNACQTPKQKLITLLLLDTGLRPTQLIQLQWKHIQFAKNELEVVGKTKCKTIPLTQRLLQALSEYYQTQNNATTVSYLFPSTQKDKPHIGRKQVWKIINQKSRGTINPTMLRNTFNAKLLNRKNPAPAKALLENKLSKASQHHSSTSETKSNWFQKLNNKLFTKTPIHIIPAPIGLTKFHIGRKAELQKLHELGKKKVNLLITGEQGIGKTHLLDNYQLDKTIRVGDLSTTKRMLAGLLLHLFETDKESIAKTIYETKIENNDLQTIIYKETIKRISELLIQITQKHEYTIIIDDVTRIPPTGVKALEKLKNHFHIICAARKVKIQNITFLTNFERLELQPLSRPESIELINRLSAGFKQRIEDYETFKNHIYENTNGNPLFIIEMCERYQKEPVITVEVIREHRHTAALKEIDFSLPLVIVLSSLMVLRYVSGELGDDSGALRLFGGIFLMFALFARNIFRAGKRKHV